MSDKDGAAARDALFGLPNKEAQTDRIAKDFMQMIPQQYPSAPYYESALNVCRLLRDAWLILDDGPDDSDVAKAEDKVGEAMAISRQILKDLTAAQSA